MVAHHRADPPILAHLGGASGQKPNRVAGKAGPRSGQLHLAVGPGHPAQASTTIPGALRAGTGWHGERGGPHPGPGGPGRACPRWMVPGLPPDWHGHQFRGQGGRGNPGGPQDPGQVAFLHVEAPDEAGHSGDSEADKVQGSGGCSTADGGGPGHGGLGKARPPPGALGHRPHDPHQRCAPTPPTRCPLFIWDSQKSRAKAPSGLQ